METETFFSSLERSIHVEKEKLVTEYQRKRSNHSLMLCLKKNHDGFLKRILIAKAKLSGLIQKV